MVTFVNESAVTKTMSIDSIFNEMSMGIIDAIHECEMGILTEKYNYVCENGEVASEETEKTTIGNKVKMLVNKAIKAVKEAFAKLWATIRKKYAELKDAIKAMKYGHDVDKYDAKIKKHENDIDPTTRNKAKIDRDMLKSMHKDRFDAYEKKLRDLENEAYDEFNGIDLNSDESIKKVWKIQDKITAKAKKYGKGMVDEIDNTINDIKYRNYLNGDVIDAEFTVSDAEPSKKKRKK